MKHLAGGLLACLLLIFGLAIARTVRMDRHIGVAAELSDTEWTLYFKNVPGTAVRYRAPGTAVYVDATPDPQYGQWYMGRVHRPSVDTIFHLLVGDEVVVVVAQGHDYRQSTLQFKLAATPELFNVANDVLLQVAAARGLVLA